MISTSPQQTMQIAEALAKALRPGSIVCLHGELGSGKTTFVKGLAKGLNITAKNVNSPTFVLLNIYEGKVPLYHFDLYRLEDPREINRIGYEEFLFAEGISVIEWAELLKELYPQEYIKIELRHKSANEREIALSAVGEDYELVIKKIEKKVMR